ncbi:hypothetical protein N7454_001505 [Penicillium verhagenii]|nr:hypothetical protein N7454_001505 [Penicillium verhagenii]
MSIAKNNESWLRGGEELRGQRLLPHVIDHHAHRNPNRVFACVPKSQDIADGFEDIDMKSMATAVDFMAWWLNEHSKSVPGKDRVLAYVGMPDMRYPILLFAAIKAGWTAMWVSPRNPAEQNAYLLRQAGVSLILYADILETAVKGIQQIDRTSSWPSILVPSVGEVMNGRSSPYPYDALYEDIKNENCLIMHTSGSTGLPKIVSYTHAAFACTDSDRNISVPEGRRPQNAQQFDFSPPGRFYCCFPPFHLAGTMAFMIIPTFSTTATPVWGPSTSPPSGQLVSSIMDQITIRAFYVPPSVIEQFVTLPNAYKQAESLDFVLYGGGPLSPSVGHKLSKLADVCQMYGSIESGRIQMLVPQPGEWQYLELNPAEECDMQEVEEDSGLFEMVLHQDEKFKAQRTLSHTFPDVKEWRTKDLFTRRPTKSGLWQFHSRTDDLIALGTSAKVFPVPMETALQGDPNIAGALVVGNGRPAVLLIIEPVEDMKDVSKDEFIDKIWASVEEANAAVPSQGKISRSRIILTDPAVGFLRTPKGTIARKASEAHYAETIDGVFRDTVFIDDSLTSTLSNSAR